MATILRTKSSAPAAARGKFDAEVDIIAIGSGVAGLATAAPGGNEVLVLEGVISTRRRARPPFGTGCRTTRLRLRRKIRRRIASPTWPAYRGRRFEIPKRPASACQPGNIRNTKRSTTALDMELLSRRARSNIAIATSCRTIGLSFPRTRRRKAASCCRKMPGNDVGRRRGRGQHHVRGGQARRCRYPHRPSRAALIQKRRRQSYIGQADTGKGKRFFARKAVMFAPAATHDVELRKDYLAAGLRHAPRAKQRKFYLHR